MDATTLQREATPSDVAALCRIYNHYVLESTITFEEETVSESEMARRLAETRSARLPWLVVERGGEVEGYAHASNWRVRSAYRHSAETTVYLAPEAVGQGLGAPLYQTLLGRVAESGRHVAIGGIALPNAASIALHEKLGFRKVAHFCEVGFKFGRWIDTTYWQINF
jgi:L-amino acid N-acyltransferase YncA